MRRDDRDDPFEDIFRQLERMMNDMMGEGNVDMNVVEGTGSFGADTHVDVHETDDDVRVVADLPGITKDDIDLKCDGEVLTLDASGAREYHERVRLPAAVDEHSAQASHNNGILEVSFDRVDDSANIDLS